MIGGVDPLRALPADLDAWSATQQLQGARTATIARRLTAVSSWYRYLRINTAGDQHPIAARNPVADAARPRRNLDYSPTIGLAAAERDRLLDAADADRPTSGALIHLLYAHGLRVGSALTARVEDLGSDRGHRTLAVIVKGKPSDEPNRIPLPDTIAARIDQMLAQRGDPSTGPLFLTPAGGPIYHMYVYRLVKRLARAAQIPAADRLSPHSLRATAITDYLDATNGNTRAAQRFAGHARPETTMGYDKRHARYEDHGAHVLAQHRPLPQ
jgi:integrase